MSHKINITSLFKTKQKEIETDLEKARLTKHPTGKGDATENVWINLLKEHLPSRYCISKAFVIDHEGNVSDQIDAVIYDSYYSKFIFSDGTNKYIPVESVYAVLEIKQTLNTEYIKYAVNKIESVKKLKRTSKEIRQIKGEKVAKKPLPIIGGLLTTNTKWADSKIKSNIESNIKNHSSTRDRRINYIVCLEKGVYKISYKNSRINVTESENDKTAFYAIFWLLILLQDRGNSPAIDYEKYGVKNAYKGVDEDE